jgi:hypothetical protein
MKPGQSNKTPLGYSHMCYFIITYPKFDRDRPSTPSLGPNPSAAGTPNSSTALSAINNNATKEKGQLTKFEEMVASQVHVDIDIGDF